MDDLIAKLVDNPKIDDRMLAANGNGSKSSALKRQAEGPIQAKRRGPFILISCTQISRRRIPTLRQEV